MRYMILLGICAMLAACNPNASVKPEAPLKTSGSAAPTKQCQELRKQGGSC